MQQSILIHAILVLGAAATAARADDDEKHDKLVPSITVVGEGEVQVRPDMANVTVGVTTEAAAAATALAENNQRMAQLLKTLREHNIPDKDVQTSSFHVAPKQSYDRDRREPPKIVGYTVTNQVSVKVAEVTRLGAILDAIVQAGGNQIHGVGFSLADPKTHLDQARRKAMADARSRAELYAGEAAVKLGSPLLIQEQIASIPRPEFFGAQVRAVAVAAEVPISQGEQTVTAQVSVTYAIVP